jgi:PilZ domain-containing protein
MSAAIKLDLNGENRRSQRRTVVEDARIVNKRGGWSLINCTVRDISEGGAKLQIAPSVEIPTEFDLLLVKEMQIIPVRIRWRRRDFMGVQFTAPTRTAPPFRLC